MHEYTVPPTPPYDPGAGRRRFRRWVGGALLIVGLFGALLTPGSVLSGLSGLLNAIPSPPGLPTSVPSVPSVPVPNLVADLAQAQAQPVAQDQEQAIKQLIEQANNQQVQAIAARDPSLMARSATPDHYQELVRVNQDLLDSGVSRIELLGLEWGSVTIDGNTAHASTTETWRATYANGSTDRSRDRNDYTLFLDNGSWKIAANDHPDQRIAPPGPAPEQPAPPSAPTRPGTSRNWSGYATSQGNFTAVSGTWTVPDASGIGTGFAADATWVGIGGVRSRDLIQAGTQESLSGNGRVHYEAWIELLPRPSRPVPLNVKPGDVVSVSIDETGPDTWDISFLNRTTGDTYSQTVNYQSSHSSAEWVEEAPSASRRGVLPLDNFGTVNFTDASAVRDGERLSPSALGARAITMIDRGGQDIAVPSPLSADGTAFSISRTGLATADTPSE